MYLSHFRLESSLIGLHMTQELHLLKHRKGFIHVTPDAVALRVGTSDAFSACRLIYMQNISYYYAYIINT